MFGFSKKSAPKAEDVYVIVFRGPGVRGFEETANRTQAMEAFRQCVGTGYFNPGDRRRMYVTGPKYRIWPEDPSDPLLIGPAALRAVFTDEEYAALPQVLLAAALVVAL